jgi:hypothetical protein
MWRGPVYVAEHAKGRDRQQQRPAAPRRFYWYQTELTVHSLELVAHSNCTPL